MARLTALSYGGTAAIVTGMGLVVAFHTGAMSRPTLIGSLLIIAVADNLADSLAIHVYQESEKLEAKQAFRATVTNYLARLLVAASYILVAASTPDVILVPVAIAWGLSLLCTLTYFVARARGASPLVEVGKHIAVAVVVILLSRVISDWIIARVTP